jgi:predicted DNA-binding protein (MmcQ/YjbR family)
MVTRTDVIEHVKQTYGVEADHPFERYPNYVAFRHPDDGKWFGLLMNVSPDKVELEGDEDIDILDVKCSPEDVKRLKGEEGFAPAYHMNKQHWITVVLNSPVNKQRIYDLIDGSFNATS